MIIIDHISDFLLEKKSYRMRARTGAHLPRATRVTIGRPLDQSDVARSSFVYVFIVTSLPFVLNCASVIINKQKGRIPLGNYFIIFKITIHHTARCFFSCHKENVKEVCNASETKTPCWLIGQHKEFVHISLIFLWHWYQRLCPSYSQVILAEGKCQKSL